MDKTAFDGIGEMVATLPTAEGVAGGQTVKLDAEGRAAPCGAGERFCGVALEPKEGFAAVQMGGFAELKCTDAAVTPGWAELCADGAGGVKSAGASGAGGAYLVVRAGDGRAVVLL